MSSPPNPAQKQRMLATLEQAIAIVRALPEDRSCRGCDWLGAGGVCGHWKVVVPAEAQAEGCERWIEGIPF